MQLEDPTVKATYEDNGVFAHIYTLAKEVGAHIRNDRYFIARIFRSFVQTFGKA